jgi:hypothetical protein
LANAVGIGMSLLVREAGIGQSARKTAYGCTGTGAH